MLHREFSLTQEQQKWLEENLGFKFNKGDLSWNDIENDLQAWQEVWEFLFRTAYLSQEYFNKQLDSLEKLLQKTSLFQRLDSDEIEVSEAHVGTTPYRHSIDVLKLVATDNFALQARVLLRLLALTHDLGKLGHLKKNDPERKRLGLDHGFLGAVILQVLLAELNFPEDLIKNLLFLVANHHLFEWLQKKKIPDQEVGDAYSFKLLWLQYLLALADTESIKPYNGYLTDIYKKFLALSAQLKNVKLQAA